MNLLSRFFGSDEQTLKFAKILSRTDLFENCSRREIIAVAEKCSRRSIDSGDIIIKKGQEADGLYVIEKGQVSVSLNDGVEKIAVLGAGKYFGEMALLDEKKRAADVYCDAPGSLLRLSRKNFYKLLRSNQKLAAKILFTLARTLSERLREMNARLES